MRPERPLGGEEAMQVNHLPRPLVELARLLSALLLAFAAPSALPALPAAAGPARTTVVVEPDGTVRADGVVIAESEYLSAAAREASAKRLRQVVPPTVSADGVVAIRAATDAAFRPILARWLAIHPATIHPAMMNGVQTDIVMPAAGVAPENRRRVLINLHGGGFFTGARLGGQVESVPLAGQGRITVVTVDYRLAPEARFPAASEDVARVYQALLRRYRPENIGIYGCSAGGTLVAQSMAWFQRHHLPRPGAIGIFCSGVMPSFWYGGDAGAIAPLLNGRAPTGGGGGAGNLYLDGVERNDPLVTPGLFPDTLARFPPTLLLTSTRDSAMSNTLTTNLRLLQAGVETQLLVLEGLGHGEVTNLPGTPEAAQAYSIIWRFFDRHLGRQPARAPRVPAAPRSRRRSGRG